jgi:hypothetical protein
MAGDEERAPEDTSTSRLWVDIGGTFTLASSLYLNPPGSSALHKFEAGSLIIQRNNLCGESSNKRLNVRGVYS